MESSMKSGVREKSKTSVLSLARKVAIAHDDAVKASTQQQDEDKYPEGGIGLAIESNNIAICELESLILKLTERLDNYLIQLEEKDDGVVHQHDKSAASQSHLQTIINSHTYRLRSLAVKIDYLTKRID